MDKFVTFSATILAFFYALRPWLSSSYFQNESASFNASKEMLGEIEEEQVLEALVELEVEKQGERIGEEDFQNLKKEIVSRFSKKTVTAHGVKDVGTRKNIEKTI